MQSMSVQGIIVHGRGCGRGRYEWCVLCTRHSFASIRNGSRTLWLFCRPALRAPYVRGGVNCAIIWYMHFIFGIICFDYFLNINKASKANAFILRRHSWFNAYNSTMKPMNNMIYFICGNSSFRLEIMQTIGKTAATAFGSHREPSPSCGVDFSISVHHGRHTAAFGAFCPKMKLNFTKHGCRTATVHRFTMTDYRTTMPRIWMPDCEYESKWRWVGNEPHRIRKIRATQIDNRNDDYKYGRWWIFLLMTSFSPLLSMNFIVYHIYRTNNSLMKFRIKLIHRMRSSHGKKSTRFVKVKPKRKRTKIQQSSGVVFVLLLIFVLMLLIPLFIVWINYIVLLSVYRINAGCATLKCSTKQLTKNNIIELSKLLSKLLTWTVVCNHVRRLCVSSAREADKRRQPTART